MSRERGRVPPSWSETSKLVVLLDEYQMKRGVVRLVVRQRIHDLINNMPLIDGIEQVNTINDEQHLNILLGCGVRGALYHAVVKRKAEMMGL